MYNLYSFLYFTLSSSILAAFLLLLKRLLLDKLSPRWQYGVWSVLALRLVLPLAESQKELTVSLLLLLESLKNLVEPSLGSSYTRLAQVTGVSFPLPWLSAGPSSVTDWLFVLYAAGFWLTLLWYALRYLQLRILLKKSRPPSDAVGEKLSAICQAYGLNACPACQVHGLSSAFICGILRPILVIPAGTIPEDGVLLHELLHLRHRDALQNLFWCYFKALNWCNPFLRYVCRLIGNDLESLCDQRVLERLSGEARRNYGLTLLSMANERYPRAPGTTSLSNGGAFIARRIEAIARFKRYPQGMAVVSVCLCVLIAVTFFLGNTGSVTLSDGDSYLYGSPTQRALSAASARLYRCTTLAGALDTYAKGLINENLLYVAAASPAEARQSLLAGAKGPWLEANDWQYGGSGDGYTVFNLSGSDGGIFTGQIVYEIGPAAGDPPPPENTVMDWYAIYPFRAGKTDGRWWVEPDGEAFRQTAPDGDDHLLPMLTQYRAEGTSGTAAVYLQVQASIRNAGGRDHWGNRRFDHRPDPDAVFSGVTFHHRYEYLCSQKPEGLFRASMLLQSRESPEEAVRLVDHAAQHAALTGREPDSSPYITGSGNDGASSISRQVDDSWDGVLSGGSGHGYSGSGMETGDFVHALPYDFVARIILNGKTVEDLYLKEVR